MSVLEDDGGTWQCNTKNPVPQEKIWRHLVKRMYDECGTTKAEDFIRRVKAGEHDVPSPWMPLPKESA